MGELDIRRSTETIKNTAVLKSAKIPGKSWRSEDIYSHLDFSMKNLQWFFCVCYCN